MVLFKALGFSYSAPPPKLVVMFSGEPIAELAQEKGFYKFKYLPAFPKLNLAPIPGFPEVDKVYSSSTLFPYFAERIPDRRRPEIARLLQERNLQDASQLRLLAELGTHSATDPFYLRSQSAA